MRKTVDERKDLYYNSIDKFLSIFGVRFAVRRRRTLCAPCGGAFNISEGIHMVLKVCVGSSCHLRGSYDVIEEMKRIIKKYGVEDKVDLQATFCVGNCQNGVSLLADEVLLHNANKDNCEELFLTQVYPLIK